MEDKKSYPPGGNGRTVLISSWKCNFSIYLDIQVYYLDIQAIPHSMPSIGSLCVPSIHLFFLSYNHYPEKWHFLSLKSLLLLQFSTYRHPTGFIVKRKQVRITNYLGILINCLKKKLKLLKKCEFKNIRFFFKEIIRHTYICTKCNDNFKFIISLKSYEE